VPTPFLVHEGGQTDRRSLPLSTRKRNHIENLIRPEMPDEALLAGWQYCRGLHPHVILRSLSVRYNCVGMVFATRRTWIDPDQIPRILKDDEYKRLDDWNSTACVGDIVLYRDEDNNIAHVGVIISIDPDFQSSKPSIRVLSKWGPWAEVIHELDDVLETFGAPAEIWTDRRLP
jgi:hypothetical protein